MGECMKSILTNCVFFTKDNEIYLFGEVVEDSRFPSGHHICTSPVEEWDEENNICITKSGTVYVIKHLFDQEEYKKFVFLSYKRDYALYLLSCCRIK